MAGLRSKDTDHDAVDAPLPTPAAIAPSVRPTPALGFGGVTGPAAAPHDAALEPIYVDGSRARTSGENQTLPHPTDPPVDRDPTGTGSGSLNDPISLADGSVWQGTLETYRLFDVFVMPPLPTAHCGRALHISTTTTSTRCQLSSTVCVRFVFVCLNFFSFCHVFLRLSLSCVNTFETLVAPASSHHDPIDMASSVNFGFKTVFVVIPMFAYHLVPLSRLELSISRLFSLQFA